MRVDLDKDLQGWRPSEGQIDKHGHLIDDRIYNQKDFDRELILERRTEAFRRLEAALYRTQLRAMRRDRPMPCQKDHMDQ